MYTSTISPRMCTLTYNDPCLHKTIYMYLNHPISKKGGASEEIHYFTFVALHVRTKTWEDALYNPFSSEHFRPKLAVTKVASWSYFPKFPSNIWYIWAWFHTIVKAADRLGRVELTLPAREKPERSVRLMREKGMLQKYWTILDLHTGYPINLDKKNPACSFLLSACTVSNTGPRSTHNTCACYYSYFYSTLSLMCIQSPMMEESILSYN